MAEWVEALTDGPGVVSIRGAFATPGAIDAANAALLGDHRRGAAEATSAAAIISPSPAPMTASGTRSKSSACATRTSSPHTTPTRSSRSCRRPGSARAIRSPRSSTSSTPAARPSPCTATIIWVSNRLAEIERFPVHVHRLSPVLTLQGAVAHCDMPLESGPTLYLPYLAKLPARLLRLARPEFKDYFNNITSSCRSPRAMRSFQPRPVPRRRQQPHQRRPPHRQPPAGLLGLSAAPWRASTGQHELALYPALQRPPRRRGDQPQSRLTTPSPLAPRATRFRPISTATRRSAAWRRRPSRT